MSILVQMILWAPSGIAEVVHAGVDGDLAFCVGVLEAELLVDGVGIVLRTACYQCDLDAGGELIGFEADGLVQRKGASAEVYASSRSRPLS